MPCFEGAIGTQLRIRIEGSYKRSELLSGTSSLRLDSGTERWRKVFALQSKRAPLSPICPFGSIVCLPKGTRIGGTLFKLRSTMAPEETVSKLGRLLFFVGAGVVSTAGINLWRSIERDRLKRSQEATQLQEKTKRLVDGVTEA
ncbi:uncharacterized protein LOC116266892 [Nymphaea colorata]|nr:uncharacterized protein LOC116266892 [Nymphaea colorata]